jgi:hypothetical protein
LSRSLLITAFKFIIKQEIIYLMANATLLRTVILLGGLPGGGENLCGLWTLEAFLFRSSVDMIVVKVKVSRRGVPFSKVSRRSVPFSSMGIDCRLVVYGQPPNGEISMWTNHIYFRLM